MELIVILVMCWSEAGSRLPTCEDAKEEEQIAVVEILIFGVLCRASEARHSKGVWRRSCCCCSREACVAREGGAPLGLRLVGYIFSI